MKKVKVNGNMTLKRLNQVFNRVWDEFAKSILESSDEKMLTQEERENPHETAEQVRSALLQHCAVQREKQNEALKKLNAAYDEGYAAGYDEGYEEGYEARRWSREEDTFLT